MLFICYSNQFTTTKVQYLDLSACDISPSALLELMESCPPLRKLSLESCMLNNSVLTCVAQNAQEMEELNLCMCEGVLEKGLMQLLGNMTKWVQLTITDLDFGQIKGNFIFQMMYAVCSVKIYFVVSCIFFFSSLIFLTFLKWNFFFFFFFFNIF